MLDPRILPHTAMTARQYGTMVLWGFIEEVRDYFSISNLPLTPIQIITFLTY